MPLKQLILFLKENLLVLLKMVILERKIVIYSHTPSVVSGFVLAFCSLIPGLLGFGGTQFTSTKIKAYLKSEGMYGLPLQVYNHKTFLIPLFGLSDLDMLKDLNGYTIGTTNMLITQLPQIKIDLYINIDAKTFTLNNKALKPIVKLTGSESSFMKKLVKSVEGVKGGESWSCLENTEEGAEQFTGSNDFIRREFRNFFHEFMVDLSVAELLCGNLEPASRGSTSSNLQKLKELYDGLQSDVKKDFELKLPASKPPPTSEAVKAEATNASPKEDNKVENAKEEVKGKKEPLDEKKVEMISQLLRNHNLKFLKEWQFTINYRLWQFLHSPMLFCFSDFSSRLGVTVDTPVTADIYYENGDIYIGEVVQGKRFGNGILAYDNNKSIYEGEWLNDKRNGTGKQVTGEGKYSGAFIE